jgi:acetolactate synthase-1/2/3 large subunit
MADAEGRLTDTPGIAAVHAGPGFLNSLISVANAYKDSSPLILLSGAVRRRLSQLDSWLEVKQLEMIAPITKAQYRIDDPNIAQENIVEAYNTALSPPYGPVFIEITEDIWLSNTDYDHSICKVNPNKPPPPNPEDIRKTIEYLKQAQQPLLLLGGGVNNYKTPIHIEKLHRYLKIPIAETANGRGSFPETNPLNLGRVGFGGGSIYADRAFENADFLLALGCGLSDITTYSYAIMPKGDIIIVNLDSLTEERPIPYSEWYYTDANLFLKMLVEEVKKENITKEYSDWLQQIMAWKNEWNSIIEDALNRKYENHVNPSKFFDILNAKIEDDTIIVAGQGMHIVYTYSFLKIRQPKSFMAATNLGAMGFALPAALAAKIVYPEKEVICVVGDGEFMMTIQDLETAIREHIPIKIIVVNDYSYRVLYYRQKIQKMGRYLGTLLTNPRFDRLAHEFGAEGLMINRDSDIRSAVDEMLNSDNAFVLDLIIHKDDMPPLNLEASLKMTAY